MTASRTAAEAQGARNQSTSSPLVVDRGLQIRSEQRPEILGPDAVPRMGAEERVSDLRAEASLPEPLVLPFPEPDRLLGVESPCQGELGADPVGLLLMLLAIS